MTVAFDMSVQTIFQGVLFAIVCLIGLIGNTLVIYVVLRYSKMQTVTNMYIVNLAIADECFLIGIPFLIVTMIKQAWIFGPVVCKAYLILTSVNQFTSSLLLFVMSADRYGTHWLHPVDCIASVVKALRIFMLAPETFDTIACIPWEQHDPK